MKKTKVLIPLFVFGLSISSCTKSGHFDKDNNHYCDECGEKLSECIDNNIDGTCDICGNSWSDETKMLFVEHLGEVLPYFETSTDFEFTKYEYLESTVNGDAREVIKNCFLSTDKFICEETNYLGSPALLFYKPCNNDELHSIRAYVIYNENIDITYVDVDLIASELHSFPINTVNAYLDNKPLCDVIVPDDGTIFTYEEDEYCCSVSYNGDGAKYLQKLIDANYIVDTSMMEYYAYSYTFRALSVDRSLAVEIGISLLDNTNAKTTLKFSSPDIPNETSWPSDIQELMVDLFSETLPFTNAGFVFDYNENYESSKYHNYMSGYSYNIDAFAYIVKAFISRDDYSSKYTEDGNFYTFTKDCATYQIVASISVYESKTTIYAERKLPVTTSWPGEKITNYFDIEIDDNIPVCEGSLFSIYYENAHPNIIIITVSGSKLQLSTYIQALKDNDYTVTSDPISDYAATAPNKTIVMYINDYTNSIDRDPFFTIEIQAHEKPSVGAIFPLDEINIELGHTTYEGPIPSGESFTTSYPYEKGSGACDVMVSITGGNREEFISNLVEAGYIVDSAYSTKDYTAYVFEEDHIVVYVYLEGDNSNFIIEFGLYFTF